MTSDSNVFSMACGDFGQLKILEPQASDMARALGAIFVISSEQLALHPLFSCTSVAITRTLVQASAPERRGRANMSATDMFWAAPPVSR